MTEVATMPESVSSPSCYKPHILITRRSPRLSVENTHGLRLQIPNELPVLSVSTSSKRSAGKQLPRGQNFSQKRGAVDSDCFPSSSKPTMSKRTKYAQGQPDLGPMLVRSTPNHIVHIQRTSSPLKLRLRIIPKTSTKTRQISSGENTFSDVPEASSSSCSSRASSVSGPITPKSAAGGLPSHIASPGMEAGSDDCSYSYSDVVPTIDTSDDAFIRHRNDQLKHASLFSSPPHLSLNTRSSSSNLGESSTVTEHSTHSSCQRGADCTEDDSDADSSESDLQSYDDEEAVSDRMPPSPTLSSSSLLELAHVPFDPSEHPRPEVQFAYIALLESQGYNKLPPAIIVR